MPDRTEREKLVEKVKRCGERIAVNDRGGYFISDERLRGLAAADLLAEKGEPEESPRVEGQHLMAWLSETLQSAGVVQEDSVAGLLVEVASVARGGSMDPRYAAFLVEVAARRYVEVLSEEGEPRAWETHHRVRENQWWAPPTVRRDTAETIARLHPSATGKIRPLYPGPVQEPPDA